MVTVHQARNAKSGKTEIFLRYGAHVGAALDRLVNRKRQERGESNRADVIRELILEADRRHPTANVEIENRAP